MILGLMEPQPNTDEQYLAAMAPSVEVLIALADAIRALRESGLPHVGTQGLAEIIDDSRLRGDQLGHLGASTHSLSGLSLMAASDHARAFALLHSHAPAPAFAHIALTRAALEALVWARWLGEPGPKVTRGASAAWPCGQAVQRLRGGQVGRVKAGRAG